MNTELRVLYLIDSLGGGGAERSLAEFAEAVSCGPVRLSVRTLTEASGPTAVQIEPGYADVACLHGTGFAGKVRAARAELRRMHVDLVHTTLFRADIVGRLAAFATGVPVLTSLVSTRYAKVRMDDPAVSRVSLRAVHTVDTVTARHMTNHFHALTRAVKDSAVSAMGIDPDRVTVIERGRGDVRLGIRTPERRERTRRQLGLGTDEVLILSVGRQEFAKGQETLVRAAGLVLADHPGVRFLLAGKDGRASTDLHSVHATMGLGDRFRFLGHREDVPDLLAAADIFAFPSRYEGMGGAVVEAMALGLPVVASRIPALEEIAEDGGSAVFFPPDSEADLAAALELLINDPPLRERLGTRGREIFEDRFTLERATRRMVGLYERVVAENGRVRATEVV